MVLQKGVWIAIFSNITYGLCSAFLSLGMTKGVWSDWHGSNKAGLSTFTLTYILGALGSAIWQ